MPGAGKSTIGVLLAKQTSKDFIDTDVLIQVAEGSLLQDIVDSQGYLVLRAIEERVLLGLSCCNCVVATGGSAVYSDAAMQHLKAGGMTVFLDVDIATLNSRVHDYETRGLAKRPDQSFAELFEERLVLYRKYADLTVNCIGLTQEEVCSKIITGMQLL
ncbi:MAG: shikimate kinase [Nitrospiraceae bacterium]|jgi:shikimate kinase|nr:shikimate kinase [Nitrospiraceae bacterium]